MALARGLSRDDLRRLTASGRGCRMAARALDFADPRAESPGESFSRARFSEWGLPAPQLQKSFVDETGRILARVDFWWEQFSLVGEFDGAVKYGELLEPGERVEDVVLAEKRRYAPTPRRSTCLPHNGCSAATHSTRVGIPARRPADVVPAPPWWTTARQDGNTTEWLTAGTTLTASVDAVSSNAEKPAQINARSPSSPHTSLIIRTASAGESSGILPNPK